MSSRENVATCRARSCMCSLPVCGMCMKQLMQLGSDATVVRRATWELHGPFQEHGPIKVCDLHRHLVQIRESEEFQWERVEPPDVSVSLERARDSGGH